MAKVAGVVEINGHRYDSSSGHVVGVIDGFVRPKVTRAKKPVKKTVESKASSATRKVPATPARTVKPSTRVHHRTERSKTLVRTVVVRPALRIRESAAAVTKMSRTPAKLADKQRLNRAKLVSKSPRVSRFSNQGNASSTSSATSASVIKKAASVRPLKSSPSGSSGAAALSAVSHQQIERILDRALLTADAHKQTLKRRPNKWLRPFGLSPWLTLTLLAVMFLALVAIIIWRSVPTVAVKMASIRSHYHASIPSYTPSGYNFSAASASPGSVTIRYAARTDSGASYSLTQSSTSWDSRSLQANTLDKNQAVQTSQVGGTTVYIYGSTDNAEWVSNGNLYKLNNDGHLSSDQILQIAQSL